MKVINLFGGPGAGKSTMAYGLVNYLKTKGYSVELVTEYAKDIVWSQREYEFGDQLYITAKQNHRLWILNGKVDYVVTDSPLLLALAYQPENYYPSFKALVEEVYNKYDNINYFLPQREEYDPNGRYQSKEEAEKVSDDIMKLLFNYEFVILDNFEHLIRNLGL